MAADYSQQPYVVAYGGVASVESSFELVLMYTFSHDISPFTHHTLDSIFSSVYIE